MFKTLLVCLIALCIISSVRAEETSATACDVCLSVVTYVEQYVNGSEADIEKALVKACSFLPPQLEGLCDTVVLVYGHQIISALLKKETPQAVCQQIKLCTNKTVEVQPEAEVISVPANDVKCTLCALLVSTAENYIAKNETEQQIAAQAKKACGILPGSMKDMCNALVDQYLPQIVEMLKNKYPANKVCHMIGLCPAQVEEEVVAEENNQFCDLCHQVVQYVENYVGSNTTTQRVIEALQQVCNFVPAQFEASCKAIIPVVWPQLIASIIAKESPAVVCKQIHLCANATRAVEKKVSSELVCNGCKYLVQYAHNYIESNTTEAQIIQVVEKACDYFPTQYQGLCSVVVEQYGKQLITQLADRILDPTTACQAVHACPTSYKEMFLRKLGISLN